MKAFFKDIFEYHHHVNQKLIDQLIENENVLSERTIPLISHTVNAHQIWNARITNNKKFGVHQLHSLQDCKHIDIQNYLDSLKILEERQLEERITYSNSKGAHFSNSIQQILFHIANHSTHHKGQIISDLRQSGIDPIMTDYIFFKR